MFHQGKNAIQSNKDSIITDYEDDRDVIAAQCSHLQNVWADFRPKSFTFLAFKSVPKGRWIEHAVRPHEESEIADLLREYSRWKFDQYFSVNSFAKAIRKKKNALPTRLAWCDLDASDPRSYDPHPSVVWETSPGRYQALWRFEKELEPVEAESYSRALTYNHGGDKNGWSVTKMLRLIGSVNHKPEYDEPFVRAIFSDWTPLAARPAKRPGTGANELLPTPISVDPAANDSADVVQKYRRGLHPKARYLVGHKKVYERDRSACIFQMTAGLYQAGASPDEIASVLWASPYFISKHGRSRKKLGDEITRILGKLRVSK